MIPVTRHQIAVEATYSPADNKVCSCGLRKAKAKLFCGNCLKDDNCTCGCQDRKKIDLAILVYSIPGSGKRTFAKATENITPIEIAPQSISLNDENFPSFIDLKLRWAKQDKVALYTGTELAVIAAATLVDIITFNGFSFAATVEKNGDNGYFKMILRREEDC